MAPARVEDDPVTAEYDVFLTPAALEKIYLLQYPNRKRDNPYNVRHGCAPDALRIKPKTGYLEVDLKLETGSNFNRAEGVKWGDAMQTAKEAHNKAGTFGLATGFSGPQGRPTTALKDAADRSLMIDNAVADWRSADTQNKVMNTLTLGGQLIKHDTEDEAARPVYFVGAFRGSELHLTKIDGTVQMRPNFHHIDAEDQRNKLAAMKDATSSTGDGVDKSKPEQSKLIQQKFKMSMPKGELDQRQEEMKHFLDAASEEDWVRMEYVDEDDMAAFDTWNSRMFVADTANAAELQSALENEEYLDAISAPRFESTATRRRRSTRGSRSEVVVSDDEAVGP